MDFFCKPGETWYFDGRTEVGVRGYVLDFNGEPLVVLDRFLPCCICDDEAESLSSAGLLYQAVRLSCFKDNFTREKQRRQKEKKLLCDRCGHRLSLDVTETQEYMLSEDGGAADLALFQLEQPSSRRTRLWCHNCGKEFPHRLIGGAAGLTKVVRM